MIDFDTRTERLHVMIYDEYIILIVNILKSIGRAKWRIYTPESNSVMDTYDMKTEGVKIHLQ